MQPSKKSLFFKKKLLIGGFSYWQRISFAVYFGKPAAALIVCNMNQYQFVWRSNFIPSPIMHVISVGRLLSFKTLWAFVPGLTTECCCDVHRWAITLIAKTNLVIAIFSLAVSYWAKTVSLKEWKMRLLRFVFARVCLCVCVEFWTTCQCSSIKVIIIWNMQRKTTILVSSDPHLFFLHGAILLFLGLFSTPDSCTFRLTPTPSGGAGKQLESADASKHIDAEWMFMLLTAPRWYFVVLSILTILNYFCLTDFNCCMCLVSSQASVTNSDVIFLKLHAPWDVLCRYAELMNIRMPFRWDNKGPNICFMHFIIHKTSAKADVLSILKVQYSFILKTNKGWHITRNR